MNRSKIQWLLTIAGLSGIASIFFDFAGDTSPFASLFEYNFWILGAPFLLSVVISASVIRWNLSSQISLLEQIATYSIGLAAIASAIWVPLAIILIAICVNLEPRNNGLLYGFHLNYDMVLSSIFSISALIAGIFLVIRNYRRGKFKNLSSIMLMQTAYLSHGLLWLIRYYREWQIGAYFTLVTMVAYLAQMVWISCQKKETIVKEQIRENNNSDAE